VKAEMPVIYSSTSLHPEAEALLRPQADFVVASSLDAATQLREAGGADVVIVRAPLPPALFANAPKLKAAIRHGAGIDMIPYDEATHAGVLIANVPGVNAPTVAEHVFMVSLMLLRQLRRIDATVRGDGWNAARETANANRDISGKTIGIIGYGNIGGRIANIARLGFGMDVLIHTRTKKDNVHGRFVGLEELLGQSDIVVLCAPLSPETRGLMNAERIGRLKTDAILVNVSRGPVIDDDALISALAARRIAGAALDVFVEQPLPSGHPYYGLDNVVITPHMAGLTEESMMRMGLGAAEEALRVLRGDLPKNLRNPEALPAFHRRFTNS
jgi:D-3-phosphoglycerate dehydrogenase